MTSETSFDQQEVARFSQLASQWWNVHGPLKTLHDINPTRIDFMQNHIHLSKLRVLDVGCGAGILSEALAQAGAEVCAIDAGEEVIQVARLHAQNNGLTIQYDCILVEDYEAPDFDVLCCMEMLEHVNNPELVIKHCSRLLKPGGHLFLSTINRTLTAYGAAIVAGEYLLGLLPRQTHDYRKFIKPAELAAMARAAGLEVIDLQGMNYNPFTSKANLQPSVAVNYLMACFKPLS